MLLKFRGYLTEERKFIKRLLCLIKNKFAIGCSKHDRGRIILIYVDLSSQAAAPA